MQNLKQHIPANLAAGIGVLLLVLSLAVRADAYESRSSNANRIRLDVRPVQLEGGQQARFQIRMNTHSVNLGYDLVAVALLEDDQGRKYRPLTWDGSPPGGHHRSGILEFPAIAKDSKVITLYIKIEPDRIFEWKLVK